MASPRSGILDLWWSNQADALSGTLLFEGGR